MRILMVDDEPNICKTVRRMLRDTDHCVEYAGSVQAARELLEIQRPDVVVSDVMMPGETGADLHRWLQERRDELAARFAFMTGGIRDPKVRAYVEGAGVPIVEKPFMVAELMVVLKNLAGDDDC